MKNTVIKFAVAIFCCGGISGCAIFQQPWPEAGHGGFAEWRPINDERTKSLDHRLQLASDRGAQIYAAGAFVDAELLLNRCRRELEAGLDIDAAADLERLDRKTAEVEAELKKGRAYPRPKA